MGFAKVIVRRSSKVENEMYADNDKACAKCPKKIYVDNKTMLLYATKIFDLYA